MAKIIPLVERLSNPKYRYRFKPDKIEQYVYLKQPIVDDVTGRPAEDLVKTKVSNDKLKQFKISDFCIENLQLSGAIDTQTMVSLNRDPLTQIATLEQSAMNIVNNNKK